MTQADLGRLEFVPPRNIWGHEALHFTPWLLQNVDVLSDLLGMDLVLEVAEHPVGTFTLDLKGYDEATGETVIVENQLEQSDHTHLGQIITYAAGTEPTTIVWVATDFRPEHRAAIDWLNERTDEHTRFFGVVIRVVKIGNSQPAPNFELVAQPNDWEKQVKKAAAATGTGSSGKALAYRQFWEFTLEQLRSSHPEWTRSRTTDQSWCNTSLGLSGIVIAMAWVSGRLVIQVYFDSSDAELNKARFEWLRQHRPTVESHLEEATLAGPLTWDEMPGRKAARVIAASTFENITDSAQWPQMVAWLMSTQTSLRQALTAVGGVSAMRHVTVPALAHETEVDPPTDSNGY